MSTVVVVENSTSIELADNALDIISVGIQGPTGPAGPPGSAGAAYVQRTAAYAIGAHRAVYVSDSLVYYASNDDLATARVVGISATAVNISEQVQIQVGGELTGMSGLTADLPVYVGLNGVLTQTPPTTGYIQQLGIALSTTTMLIEVQPIILLEA